MGKKLLIVDDEQDILKVVTLRLKRLGYEVLTADDGKKAIDMIKAERPDLVLLDHLLPIVSGGEVCQLVKSDPELKDIPIVLLSACADVVIKRAKEFGAEDYLIKPFESSKLLEMVEQYIGGGE